MRQPRSSSQQGLRLVLALACACGLLVIRSDAQLIQGAPAAPTTVTFLPSSLIPAPSSETSTSTSQPIPVLIIPVTPSPAPTPTPVPELVPAVELPTPAAAAPSPPLLPSPVLIPAVLPSITAPATEKIPSKMPAMPLPVLVAPVLLPPVVTPPVQMPRIITPVAPEIEVPPVMATPALEPAYNASLGPKYIPAGIIRVSGKTFVDDSCREYTFSGWNQWYDAIANAVATSSSLAAQGIHGAAALTDDNEVAIRFKNATIAGMNTFRFFGHGDGQTIPALQYNPGMYNETIFQGIDYVIAQAAKHNLKVIIALSTFWNDFADGLSAYAGWAGVSKDNFWVDPRARALYTAHMKVMANRVNTFSGVAYKNDPTIFAWNLMNEPRYPANQEINSTIPEPSMVVRDWYDYMAAYMKSADPNHMVTTGEEGFFAANTPYTQYNPFGTPSNVQPGWAGHIGQDAFSQHMSPNIDYVDMHLWPDNWNASFIPIWIDGHIKAATAIGKPLVLEEFGKVASGGGPGPNGGTGTITTVRDPVFKVAYSMAQASLAANGALKGCLFWEWVAPGSTPSSTGVLDSDPTWQYVTQNAAFVNNLAGRPVPGCVAISVPPVVTLSPPSSVLPVAAGR